MDRKYVIVYQMGRVGSSLIYNSFNNQELKVFHTHYLNKKEIREIKEYASSKKLPLDFKRIMDHRYEAFLFVDNMIKENSKKTYFVITVVRDPISVIISYFFMYFSLEGIRKKSIKRVKGRRSNDKVIPIEDLKKKFLNTIKNYKSVFKNNNILDRAKSYYLQFPLNFFDIEMKNSLGIDVYKIPFDNEKGYNIYKNEKVKILLLKYEVMFDNIEENINNFLDIDNFRLKDVRSRRTKSKNRYYHYQEFIKDIVIPDEVLKYYYSSKYVKHFYSEEEIKSFYEKWGKRGLV